MRGSGARALVPWLSFVLVGCVAVGFWATSSTSVERPDSDRSYASLVPAAATIEDATPTEAVSATDPPSDPAETTTSVTAESAKTPAGNAALVSVAWARTMSARVGIPWRAVLGYAGATVAAQRTTASCHLDWTTLAAIGDIESGHGTTRGSSLDSDGVARPSIFGPALVGSSAVGWTSARGPLQFIASTWARWGSDGNGDGRKDPQQIDDAALSTARYLCSYGNLSSAATWREAIFGYNHLDSYVASVIAMAARYAALSKAGS